MTLKMELWKYGQQVSVMGGEREKQSDQYMNREKYRHVLERIQASLSVVLVKDMTCSLSIKG